MRKARVIYPSTDKCVFLQPSIQTCFHKHSETFQRLFSQCKCSVKPSHPVALSGLQAAPLAVLPKASLSLPDGLQQDATHPDVYETAADGFRQGTEPSRRLLVDLNTGLVKEHISNMNRKGMSAIPLYEVLLIWPIVSSYEHIFARCKV